ncbi:hypothetical protein RFI_08408 [Reticulomyxa filosa]|uniref:Uncharacterized protein n=1 Tax=Reticulomyxa filosa TaxID=46433 RepID=X6NTU6_RETFI|nr:hypothetical protein RFI_08408 [Reticulomyxa filosa]|eukprot:ETO28717.1 hypothetical protein RFI_08408 [Reticulomyxa filosa]
MYSDEENTCGDAVSEFNDTNIISTREGDGKHKRRKFNDDPLSPLPSSHTEPIQSTYTNTDDEADRYEPQQNNSDGKLISKEQYDKLSNKEKIIKQLDDMTASLDTIRKSLPHIQDSLWLQSFLNDHAKGIKRLISITKIIKISLENFHFNEIPKFCYKNVLCFDKKEKQKYSQIKHFKAKYTQGNHILANSLQ